MEISLSQREEAVFLLHLAGLFLRRESMFSFSGVSVIADLHILWLGTGTFRDTSNLSSKSLGAARRTTIPLLKGISVTAPLTTEQLNPIDRARLVNSGLGED